MDLYLFRHAIAYDPDPLRWADDRERPLTPKGIKRFRKEARGLRGLVKPADLLLSSRLVRAWDTAQILTAEAGWPKPATFEPLEPGHGPAEVMAKLGAYADAEVIGLVGHEPGLHQLLAYLLVGSEQSCGIEFRKGGVARVRFEEGPHPGAGTLRSLIPPKLLRKLAK
jgi:phosphohistidine phosphatase